MLVPILLGFVATVWAPHLGWNAVESRATQSASSSMVVKAAKVYDGKGGIFEPGAVVILDGKVVAVGKDPGIPAGAKIIECGEAEITPGLIDAACQLGTNELVGFSEQSSEVIPHLDIADAVDYDSKLLGRLAREGVTTIFVTPEASSVIGSKAAVIKTGGFGISRLLESPVTIKANIARESMSRGSFNRAPSRFSDVTFLVRRPTTRMGSTWVFRKAFYDAMHFKETGETDADARAMEVLAEALDGNVALRFQARKSHDIHTAQRLCEEFGLAHTLEYALEAFRCLDVLENNKTRVIFGPLAVTHEGLTIFDDSTKPCLTTPVLLRDRGIEFCLTACDGFGDRGLARVAGHAVRYGLTREEALNATTLAAARILGVDASVGTLANGTDADLVVWNGVPLENTSKPILVLIDGKPVHDVQGFFAEP